MKDDQKLMFSPYHFVLGLFSGRSKSSERFSGVVSEEFIQLRSDVSGALDRLESRYLSQMRQLTEIQQLYEQEKAALEELYKFRISVETLSRVISVLKEKQSEYEALQMRERELQDHISEQKRMWQLEDHTHQDRLLALEQQESLLLKRISAAQIELEKAYDIQQEAEADYAQLRGDLEASFEEQKEILFEADRMRDKAYMEKEQWLLAQEEARQREYEVKRQELETEFSEREQVLELEYEQRRRELELRSVALEKSSEELELLYREKERELLSQEDSRRLSFETRLEELESSFIEKEQLYLVHEEKRRLDFENQKAALEADYQERIKAFQLGLSEQEEELVQRQLVFEALVKTRNQELDLAIENQQIIFNQKKLELDSDYQNKLDAIRVKEASLEESYQEKIQDLVQRESALHADYQEKYEALLAREAALKSDYANKERALLLKESDMDSLFKMKHQELENDHHDRLLSFEKKLAHEVESHQGILQEKELEIVKLREELVLLNARLEAASKDLTEALSLQKTQLIAQFSGQQEHAVQLLTHDFQSQLQEATQKVSSLEGMLQQRDRDLEVLREQCVQFENAKAEFNAKKESLEKAYSDKDRQCVVQVEEIALLKERFHRAEKNQEELKRDIEVQVSDRLRIQHEHALDLLKEQFVSERQLLEQKIASLEDTVALKMGEIAGFSEVKATFARELSEALEQKEEQVKLQMSRQAAHSLELVARERENEKMRYDQEISKLHHAISLKDDMLSDVAQEKITLEERVEYLEDKLRYQPSIVDTAPLYSGARVESVPSAARTYTFNKPGRGVRAESQKSEESPKILRSTRFSR